MEDLEAADREAAPNFSDEWWDLTKRMVDRGFRQFCRKRHWQVAKPLSFRQQINADVHDAQSRRGRAHA